MLIFGSENLSQNGGDQRHKSWRALCRNHFRIWNEASAGSIPPTLRESDYPSGEIGKHRGVEGGSISWRWQQTDN